MTEELGWLRLALVFVASVVGGLSNIFGGLLGGYVVGLSTVLGAAYILAPLNVPIEFQLIIPFSIVIVILLFMYVDKDADLFHILVKVGMPRM